GAGGQRPEVDRLELLAVAQEERLLDGHLVDELLDELLGSRPQRALEDARGRHARPDPADRRLQGGELGVADHDAALAQDEPGDVAQGVGHRAAARRSRSAGAISSRARTAWAPALTAAAGMLPTTL